MADLTVATVSAVRTTLWSVPTLPQVQWSAIPRGEVLFQGSQVLPAIISDDEQLWTLQCNFPRGFHYRIIESRVNVFAGDFLFFEDHQYAMSVLVSSDAPGMLDWTYGMYSTWLEFRNKASFQTNFDGETNNQIMQFHPRLAGPGMNDDVLIDCASGAARLFLRWFNGDSTSTGATLAQFRFRALMYDQDQVTKYPVHSPLPTISA